MCSARKYGLCRAQSQEFECGIVVASKRKKSTLSEVLFFLPLFHFLFPSLFDFLQWKCSSLINLSSVLRESFPVNSIFVCQFHDSVIVKSCRKKRSIVTIQSGWRVGGGGGGDDKGTTALLLPARLHSLSFLSSFPPLSCSRALPSPRLRRPPCQSPFHPLARFSSALLTHDVLSLAVFPLGFGDGRETLVSFAGPRFPC